MLTELCCYPVTLYCICFSRACHTISKHKTVLSVDKVFHITQHSRGKEVFLAGIFIEYVRKCVFGGSLAQTTGHVLEEVRIFGSIGDNCTVRLHCQTTLSNKHVLRLRKTTIFLSTTNSLMMFKNMVKRQFYQRAWPG